MSEYPPELFETTDPVELSARMGRYAILEEMGFFGDKTNTELALGKYSGTFIGGVRKRFNSTYGDVRGCEPADIEIAGEMLGVFDDVWDAELKSHRHIRDRRGL